MAQVDAVGGGGDSTPIAVLRAGWTTRVSVPLVLLLLGAAGGLVAEGAGERTAALAWSIGFGVVGLFVALFAWVRRARITREGLEVRGLLGTRRVRWADLERFDYDARRYRIYPFVPLGRVARLRLSGGGRRVVFGAGFRRFDEVLPVVVDLAVSAVVPRLREAIDRGERAQLGRRLSVDAVRLYVSGRLYGETSAAIDEVRIEVENGLFRISSPDRLLGRFSAADTPNLLALPQLLEELSVNRGRPRPSALVEALRRG